MNDDRRSSSTTWSLFASFAVWLLYVAMLLMDR
jgi:hypothetical protein